jgi:CheY-like chemotaxis protein
MAMEPRDTILVVDDTADVADLLRDVLSGAGYRVLVAPTLELGLTILAAFVVRLVLIDAPTPTDDAGDAGNFWGELDRLAHEARRIPLIVYADDNPERYADYAAHGYAAHLAKPLDLDALVVLVADLLRAGQAYPAIAHGTATASKG